MGPEAAVDLMRRVIEATPALDDVDHVRMIVDNNPKIPSRIKAIIEGGGEDPAPHIVEMARKLAAWGADFLAIPCNTAHYYYDDVRSAVDIPVLNMIQLTADAIVTENPSLQTAGVLASTAVSITGLYQKCFEKKGVSVMYPSREMQDRLMTAIRTIKTSIYGEDEKKILRSAARELKEREAGALIVGCTELSIIFNAVDVDAPLYDSAQILAENIVRFAKRDS
ncbi:MAG: aspartate/glutamate racemase family protein [Desulfobacterales bacterium]|nr:aspartate/glutamate racemase family protein [Desulfobacterales bacterium]